MRPSPRMTGFLSPEHRQCGRAHPGGRAHLGAPGCPTDRAPLRGTQIDRERHAIRYLQRPAGPGNLCSHKQDSTPLAAPLSTAALEPAREPGFVEDHPAAEAAGEGKAAGARLAIEPV